MFALNHRLILWCALGVVVLGSSGCAYVKSWYGGSNAPQSQPVAQRTAPQGYTAKHVYRGEISAARAYVAMQLPATQRMMMIDVRDATEFRQGHPDGARHVPYPRIYQQCQPHPSGAPEASLRSDDGSECRYGSVPSSEVRSSPADFWQAVQEVLPYRDAPVAVLCRTGACAADAAQVLAQPERWVGAQWAGKGYTQVYVVREGFVGEPVPATFSTEDGVSQVLTADKKGQKLKLAQPTGSLYGVRAVPLDADGDGRITQADLGGWRNFLGLPYVVSMPANARSEAAESYYDRP